MTQTSQPCSVKHLHHTCIAVKDIQETMKFYTDLFGIEVPIIKEIPDQGVRACLMTIGGSELELIEPTDPEGAIARFIERKGEGLHHIALEVDNISEKLALLQSKGVDLIDQKARSGLAGTIAFLHPKATRGVLIELVETD